VAVEFDLLIGLTEAQMEVVQYHEGPLLIIAGPGSGKTEVISRRTAYLISSGLAKPESLLVTTFTEKAALELKDRIQKKLKDINVERIQVSTIHSFCFTLLDEFRDESPFPKGFRVLDEAAQLLFIYSRRKDLGLGDLIKGRECDFFGEVIRTYNLATEELVEPAELANYCEGRLKEADEIEKALWEERTAIANSYQRYLDLLLDSNVTDFSNLQRHTLNMLEAREAVLRQIQDRFTDVLIDEYQDTNAVQELILGKIAIRHKNLAVVGDDDQSIYRFRGATVKNILNFEEKYKPEKIVTLEDNFRSLGPIIDHCSRLIANNAARMYKKLRCFREKHRNDILLIHEKTAAEEAISVVSILKFLMSKGIVKQYRDVAVLLRSVRSHGKPYEEELKRNKIPFIVTRDGRFFERDDISELCSLFIFLGASKPWGDKFVRCSVMQISEETEEALRQFKQDLTSIENEKELEDIGISNKEDKRKIYELIVLKRQILEGKHQSILEVLFKILLISGYFGKIEKDQDTEALKNIGILTRIISDFDEYRGTKVLYPYLSYMKMLKQSSLDSFIKPPEDAVQVMTVHQAKGLEFPVVVIGAAMEGRFPTHSRRDKYEIPHSLMKSGKPEVEDHHTVDERKLFYVAATRARDLLIIGTSDVVNKRGGGPSRFIGELLGKNLDGALERSRKILEAIESPIKVEAVEGKPQEPRMRLSYSKFVYFLQCPIRYKYFEIDKIDTPRPYLLHFGTSVHRALELIHNELIKGRTVGAAEIERYLEKAWIPSLRIPEEMEETSKLKAMKLISEYFQKWKDTFPLIDGIEQKFAFDLEDTVISGKIDLIRKTNGNLKEIVDFKTSESKTGWGEQTELQMDLYALGAERGLDMQTEKCTIHFLGDDRVESKDWSIERIDQIENSLKDLIQKIKMQKFEPRQEYCPLCEEFKDICPYYKAE